MSRLEEALQKSIIDYLGQNGYHSVKELGSRYWFYSPFRSSENSPSFTVRKNDLKWKDYGRNNNHAHGDIIDFVQQYRNVSKSEAIDIILNGNISQKSERIVEGDPRPYFEIKEIKQIESNSLIKYITDRKLRVDIVSIYCQELVITFPRSKNPEKPYHVIGFKNWKGGYVIRNHFIKQTLTPSYCTYLDEYGTNMPAVLFEGFINFLSWLTYHNWHIPISHVIVLNGTGNWLYAEQRLKEYKEVHNYLDNDEGGNATTEDIIASGVNLIDMRSEFRPYKDYNDALVYNFKRTKLLRLA
jgi:hypothetical protein